MKNSFYFMLKALFILKIFKFLCWIFGHIEKRLDETDFKIYVTDWTEIIAINILPNISISRQSGNEIWSVNRI